MVILLLLACTGDTGPKEPPTGSLAEAPSAVLGVEDVVFVGHPTPFDAGESEGARFIWDFGDGTTAEGAAVEHTYDTPGRYTVRLTAESSAGRADTASGTRVAVHRPLEEAPVSSGMLAMADGVLYAAVTDTNEVVVVEGGEVVDRLAVCSRPVAVSVADGVLAVACRDDAVQVWETATRTLYQEHTFRWGARPVAVVADGLGAAVALAGTGELAGLSGSGHTVLATLADPGAVAVAQGHTDSSADALYATRFRSPASGGVFVYQEDTDGGLMSREYTLAPDPGPDSDTDARGLPSLLGAMAVRPDGNAVVVAGIKANMERGLVRDGLPLTHETSTRAMLRSLDAMTGEQLARAEFDNRDRVGAIAFTPLGDKLLVAHLGAGIVDVLDPYSLTRIGGFQDVGVGLDGIATDGDVAWVLASVDRELVAYDLRAGNAEIELARIALVEAEPLSEELALGKRVFHFAGDRRMSADAYVSCASCHPAGGTDARTWDFTDRGEGLRDTQALFALPTDGPFHWTANFDEIQDFENGIRAHQAGTGFLSDEDFAAAEDPLGEPKAGMSPELDALAAYVRSFAADVPRSPWREEDGSWTEAALRGRETFVARGCDTCHTLDRGTDAGWDGDTPILHDVGTLLDTSGSRVGEMLTGLRTPTLRGLFATAPYLHDGRAATVEEALAAHGIEPDADLVRYLLEIEGEM